MDLKNESVLLAEAKRKIEFQNQEKEKRADELINAQSINKLYLQLGDARCFKYKV